MSDNFEQYYESLLSEFVSVRNELLDFIHSATPSALDIHQQKWRIRQLKSANDEIRLALAACNLQLEQERSALDELTFENEELLAQEEKLLQNIQFIEGVTGIHTSIFFDTNSGIGVELIKESEKFRETLSNFMFDLPKFNGKIKIDHSLLQDASILIDTLKDYSNAQFLHRANDALYTRKIQVRTAEAEQSDLEFKEESRKVEEGVAVQYEQLLKESEETKSQLISQTHSLRMMGKKKVQDLLVQQNELNDQISYYQYKKDIRERRLKGLNYQSKSIRESFLNRGKELEDQLDMFQNRITMIQKQSNIVDKSLINISLVLTKKSKLIDQAIDKMRAEIRDFYNWVDNYKV